MSYEKLSDILKRLEKNNFKPRTREQLTGGITMDKLKVKPEGREGVWLIEKEDLKQYLLLDEQEEYHCFIGGGQAFIGAGWQKESVIDEIDKSERLAILIGDSLRNNMNHALAVISNNMLYMFDIGKITENDLINKLALDINIKV